MGPLVLLTLLSAQAAPLGFAGVEWRPLSRMDLVWVDEGRTSGTAVGEYDGAVKPVLSAFGGVWFNRYVALSAGIGLAQSVSDSATTDAKQQHIWSVVRPSLDLRFGWMQPREHFPIPWFLLGVHGDIPTVRDTSDAYTKDEQTAADASATTDRYRLGGIGGRVGAGVDYRIMPYLSIGAQLAVGLHQATYTGGDTRFTTLWVSTEASILMTFEWPGKSHLKQPKGVMPIEASPVLDPAPAASAGSSVAPVTPSPSAPPGVAPDAVGSGASAAQ